MKKVSVIVPCYNAADYLKKCMEHLLQQTIGTENIEIILVDDASTDNGKTWDMIMEYEAQYPETVIAVSLENNLRQGGARNAGVLYAGGEYLTFCDADDWLLREALEHCYIAAKENDADVVEFLFKKVTSHDVAVTLEKGSNNCLIQLETEEQRKKFLLNISEQQSLGSQKKFYRLSLIQKYQISFAEHLIFEEPSFVVPVRLYEKNYFFLDEALYVYFLSPDSTTHRHWIEEHKWDNLQVWLILMNDLLKKPVFWTYYKELEYLFFQWGFGLSIKSILSKNCILSKEEWQLLIHSTLQLFPNIGENEYILKDKKDQIYGAWENFLLTLLKLEITEESAQAANQSAKQVLQVLYEMGYLS